MKRIKRVSIIATSAILLILVMLNISVVTLNKVKNETDYSNWMSENIDNETRVLDIAMLGAHDAFSNEISYSSDVDPFLDDNVFRGVPGFVLKGFLVKQSVTQTGNVKELLSSGVRYLDIRLSFFEESWYTKHNYISGEFEPIADDIHEFLTENNGEVLVLDFQHIHGVSYESVDGYNKFYTMLNDYGLLDFANIITDLSTLTYGELTNNGEESKVIIIAPFEDTTNEVLNYEESISSNWANSDDFDTIFTFLDNDATNAVDQLGKFRVMQAVATMQMSGSGIYNSISTWSLINRADMFNTFLIERENFEELLETLPIVMVDHSDSNKYEFNEEVMKLIIEFNSKLRNT